MHTSGNDKDLHAGHAHDQSRRSVLAKAGTREEHALGVQGRAGNAAAVQLLRKAGYPWTKRADKPQVQRMDAIKKQFNAATSLFSLRKDEVAPGAPRQQAVQHIRGVLKDKGLEGEDTVGSRVADSIDGIKSVANENGARQIDKVFKNPALAALYAIPSNDPRAAAAHHKIATVEYGYWDSENKRDPSVGTNVATDVDIDTRARLQQTVGGTAAYMRRFQSAFHNDMGNNN